MISICQVVASINEDVGGPAYSVTSLSKSLKDQQLNSHLFTLDYRHHGPQILPEGVRLHSVIASPVARYFRGFQPSASQSLQTLTAQTIDIVHSHGLWMFPNVYARQAAIKNKIPLVISPRGMLETWSLNHSRFKKLPAWLLYERKNLMSARAFHATSAEELTSIRRQGFRQPVALIPNGTYLPDPKNIPGRACLEDSFPELKNKSWLLFLSRIHPKKGLDNLLSVWRQLAKRDESWHLIVAGPDLGGYLSQLEWLVKEFQLEDRVTFTGMLSGEQKAAALSHAELFVLPTHSENFGIAVAESLAYGVPVVTTHEAPWQDLATYQCGWWIPDNIDCLQQTLADAISLNPTSRQEMGQRGRALVEKQYAWSSIASQMASVYQWLLGKGARPDYVYLE